MTRPLPLRHRSSASRLMLSLCAVLFSLWGAAPHARADENAKLLEAASIEAASPAGMVAATFVSVIFDAAGVSTKHLSSSEAVNQNGARELIFSETETPVPLALTAGQRAMKAFHAAANNSSLARRNAGDSVAQVTRSATSTVTRTVGNIGRGIASWYHDKFHNRLTANGERYNMNEMTAAHKSLPFGTRLCAHYPVTGKSVVVRINDRGPFIEGRIIDFSKASAKALGIFYTKPDIVSLLPPNDRRCSASAQAEAPDAGRGQPFEPV